MSTQNVFLPTSQYPLVFLSQQCPDSTSASPTKLILLWSQESLSVWVGHWNSLAKFNLIRLFRLCIYMGNAFKWPSWSRSMSDPYPLCMFYWFFSVYSGLGHNHALGTIIPSSIPSIWYTASPGVRLCYLRDLSLSVSWCQGTGQFLQSKTFSDLKIHWVTPRHHHSSQP